MANKKVGEYIDKYQIIRFGKEGDKEIEYKEGNMGVVYKVWDESLRRSVALKTIQSKYENDKNKIKVLRERFDREGKILAKLGEPNSGSHRHVVEIYEYNTETPFICTTFITGKSLEEIIIKDKRNFNVKETIKIMYKLLEVLKHVHEKNIIHRDIKPGNIMITNDIMKDDGVLTLLDFGIAWWNDGKSPTTTDEQGQYHPVGTPKYCSSEQYKHEFDKRADLFSAGVIWYELLTGETILDRKKFFNDHGRKMIEALSDIQKQNLSEINPNISNAVSLAVKKALAVKLVDRFQTAQEFLEELQNLLKQPNSLSPKLANYLSEQERQEPKNIISFLPYMIDQNKQEDMFLDEAVKNLRTSQNEEQRKQPLLCLIHGNENCNDYGTIRLLIEERLLTRLERDLGKSSDIYINSKNINLKGRMIYLSCENPENESDLHNTIKKQLGNILMVDDRFASKDEIINNIAKQDQPTIFRFQLFIEELPDGKEIEIIEAFINFWKDWHPQKQLLLVFLIITYKEDEKSKKKFFWYRKSMADKANKMVNFFESFNFSKFNMRGITLPELRINRTHLRDWYDVYCLPSIRDFFPPESVDKEMSPLLKRDDNNLPTYQCGIPLSELVEKIKKILDTLSETHLNQ